MTARSFADSGHAWLGSIPTDWRLAPIGSVFRERRTVVSDSEFEPLSVSMAGIIPRMENVALTVNNDARKLVRAGDYVINSRSDRKGAGGIAPTDGSVSVISTVLEPRGIDRRFAHHLLRSSAFQEEFYRWGSGIVADLWSTRSQAMKRITIPTPPEREQRAIADFLDRETAKIDALIEKQNALIDRLRERREAVVERALGSLWEAKPLYLNALLIQTGPFGSQLGAAEYISGGIAVINPVHIVSGLVCPDPNVSVPPETASRLARHRLAAGDLVAARRGELGRCAVVTADDSGALCGTGSLIIRPMATYRCEFLRLVFSSRRNREHLERASVGSTMPNLNARMVGRLRLPCPEIDVQDRVVRAVSTRTAEIEDLIAKGERFVELARERRSALITAAVTGQLDVTGEVAA